MSTMKGPVIRLILTVAHIRVAERIMIGIQKGTIILTTTHILDAHPIRCCTHTLRSTPMQ